MKIDMMLPARLLPQSPVSRVTRKIVCPTGHGSQRLHMLGSKQAPHLGSCARGRVPLRPIGNDGMTMRSPGLSR